MKKSELPKAVQDSLFRKAARIEYDLDAVIQRLTDLRAQLCGGYSAEWGFEVKDPILEDVEVRNHAISPEIAREAQKLYAVSSALASYETLISHAFSFRDVADRAEKP